ncbi:MULTISPECIES: Rho-binding antiterminator [Pseudoalteromonas]|uniref:Rho-binding antiterminator n=1 Tax=Pseudoalteromonas TaxID=53246 RepID=UPI000FFEB22B|nr:MULTISPECIES: Rho-binding antiterminator [Pseudoalteromonas]MCG9759314.1 Rho-binding antiterminator [Pseudoalteromonas sp. Isolate6]NKC21050.1 transcriptional regulator [Pseudoalteromonas galatheae]RXE87780.1 transcriptional regulator [Pseudoalteromonas sp. A757]
MISCQQYDYIELACLKRLKVTIEMKDGDVVRGRCENTAIVDKQECLVLEQESQAVTVMLAEITSISADTDNPYFTTLRFQ